MNAEVKESRYQHLQRLIKNPLRLSLLCQTWYHQQGDLPETKAGLYERFVREFYQEWKPEQHPLTWTKQQQLNQALGKLALRGIDSEARFRLPESLAYEVMGEELFLLACEIGWLNLVDRDLVTGEPVYAFYHSTFQEYFSAIAIDDWGYFLPREHIDRPVPGKKYRIFESEWKEVILFWLGRKDLVVNKKEEFINQLIDFQDGVKGFYIFRSHFIAAEGIIVKGDSLINAQDDSGKKPTLNNDEISLQVLVEMLGQVAIFNNNIIGNKTIIDLLVKLLEKSNSWSTRSKIIFSLGQIADGNTTAIQSLTQILYTCLEENNSLLNNHEFMSTWESS